MTKPWEHKEFTEYHDRLDLVRHGRPFFRGSDRPFRAHYTTVSDNKQLYYRKGQVVKFGCGFRTYWASGWENWFLTEKEKLKRRPPDRKIPVYARDQYAIILNRYKWIKHKEMVYIDYGTIIMMLTGDRAGHIRRYYAQSPPFQKVSSYPYKGYRKYIGGAKVDTEYNLVKTAKKLFSRDVSVDTFLTCVYYVLRGPQPDEPEIEEIAKRWLIR